MKKYLNKKILILFFTIVLVFLGQWYFLSKIGSKLDLIKLVLGDIFLFLILPIFIIKKFFKEKISDYNLREDLLKDNQIKLILIVEGLLFSGILYAFMIKLGWIDYFKIYLQPESSWGVILLIEFLIIPLIIFSEEFFFRGFLLKKTWDYYGIFWALIIPVVASLIYVLILNSSISWQLIVMLFFINLFLNWMIIQCQNILISFFMMLTLRYLIDFYVIYYVKF